jgi:CRP/FNR family transcriptional regulator, cyclic AMP receptor protein
MDTSAFFAYPNTEQSDLREEFVLLPGLDEDGWARLLAHTVQRRFVAGETVIAAGDTDSAIHIIADGVLDVLRPGSDQPISVGAGNVIGEVAFFDGRPRSADVRARSDCTLFSLSRDRFDILAAQEPRLARLLLLDLARTLAARLRRAESVAAH